MKLHLPLALLSALGLCMTPPAGALTISTSQTLEGPQIIQENLTLSNKVDLVITSGGEAPSVVSGLTTVASYISSGGQGSLTASNTRFEGGLKTGGREGSTYNTNQTFATIVLNHCLIQGGITLYGSIDYTAPPEGAQTTSLTMAGGSLGSGDIKLYHDASLNLGEVVNTSSTRTGNISLNSTRTRLSLSRESELYTGALSGSGKVSMIHSALDTTSVSLSLENGADASLQLTDSTLFASQGALIIFSGTADIVRSNLGSGKGNIQIGNGTYNFESSSLHADASYITVTDNATVILQNSRLTSKQALYLNTGSEMMVSGNSTLVMEGSLSLSSSSQKGALLMLDGTGVSLSAKNASFNNSNKPNSRILLKGALMTFSESASFDYTSLEMTGEGVFKAKTASFNSGSELSLSENSSLETSGNFSFSSSGNSKLTVKNSSITSEGTLKLSYINNTGFDLQNATLTGKSIYLWHGTMTLSSVHMTAKGGYFQADEQAFVTLDGESTGNFSGTLLQQDSSLTIKRGARVSLGELVIGYETEDWYLDYYNKYNTGSLVIDGGRNVSSDGAVHVYRDSDITVKNGGLLTIGTPRDTFYTAADSVSLVIQGEETNIIMEENAALISDGLAILRDGVSLTLFNTARTRLNGVKLEDDGTSLLISQSTGISLSDIEIGKGATLDVLDTRLTETRVSVRSGGFAYLAKSKLTVNDDGGVTLSTESCLDGKDKLLAESGATVGTHLHNTGESVWNINLNNLRESMESAFGNLPQANYGYLLQGRVFVSNVDLTPGESLTAGDGAYVDFGDNPLEGSVVLQGGIVDVSGTGDILSDANIQGQNGSLVTSSEQTLILQNDQTAGYSLVGKNNDPSASIQIGTTDSPETQTSPSVTLTGDFYDSSQIKVASGSLKISDNTVLGCGGDGCIVTVGNRADSGAGIDTTASLTNNGTINNNVTVQEGSLLKGSGLFKQDVTLKDGTSLIVGNSPGFQSYEKNLTLDGTRLVFSIDGSSAATRNHMGSGTYSNMEAGSLSWSGDNHVVLEFGSNLLSSKTADISLDLIRYGSTSTGQQGALDREHLTLEGRMDLFVPDSVKVFWDNNRGTLTMTGTLDRQAVDDLLLPDRVRIANALWSSARSIAHFSRTLLTQLGTLHEGENNFWAGGLGDFSSVSGQNGRNGYDYNGGGYAVGADHTFSHRFKAGVSFAQTFGTNKAGSGDASFKQTGIMGGVYARYKSEPDDRNTLSLDTSLTYGNVENKASMRLSGSDSASRDKWMDNAVSVNMTASWTIKLNEHHLLTTFTGVEFLHGAQQGSTLAAANGLRRFYDGSMQNWSVPVGVNYRLILPLSSGQYLIPEITVAYIGDISRNNPAVTEDILGTPVRTEGANPGRHAIRSSAGLRWIINSHWSAGASYMVESRRDMNNQSVAGSINYAF